MLWNLSSNVSEQFFKTWNTCVKLVYGLPRNTFTYLVEGWLASDLTSLRNQIISRYPKFYRKLLSSPSKEIRVLANIAGNDIRSTTCLNLKLVRKMTNLNDAEHYSATKIHSLLPVKEVPEHETWRLGLLDSCFKVKQERDLALEDSSRICAMIVGLCTT